jgi:myo-inositol-1-phosphate synthase
VTLLHPLWDATKGNVLDDLLGYHVEDHQVHINYYRPRGDAKEAWDTIDVVGFLGQTMQLKVNFLCRDSILAAPLVLEIARVLDRALVEGQGGIAHQLGVCFKAPMGSAEHALHVQQQRLLDWFAALP